MTHQPFVRTKPRFGGTSGQAISEYMILVALIAVGSIGVLQILGTNLQRRLAVVSDGLRGKKSQINGKEVTEEHYKVRDLGDFHDGMQDNADK